MTGPVAPVSADASIITQPSGVDELASAKDAGSRLAEMPLALPSGTGQPAGKKKKKYKAKSLASRGPTALPKNRGTGFEGRREMPSTQYQSANHCARVLCRSSFDAAGSC